MNGNSNQKKIRSGTQFKIIVHNWIEDKTIDLERLKLSNPNSLKWENQQGAIGNKTMKFVNNEMIHRPQF